MSGMNEVISTTFKLKAAETTVSQYCVSVLDTATEGQVTNPSAAHVGNIAGVLRDSSLEAGYYGCYQVAGIAKVKIASAVSIGDVLVIADTAGKVEAKGTGAHTSGEGIVGRAITAGTTSGDIVKCILAIPNEYSS